MNDIFFFAQKICVQLAGQLGSLVPSLPQFADAQYRTPEVFTAAICGCYALLNMFDLLIHAFCEYDVLMYF